MQVYGFVGRSGTGKSHRAEALASQLGADAIIDDGLLMHNRAVLAGISAKMQKTKMGSVRTALFLRSHESEDIKSGAEKVARLRRVTKSGARASLSAAADEVVTEIKKNKFSKILILGTSEKMIRIITRNLHLPAPRRMITIDEIASAEERRAARNERKNHGRHAIAIPTVETRRNLPGLFIGSLRRHFSTSEISIIRPTYSYLGPFYITQKALRQIIMLEIAKSPFNAMHEPSIYEKNNTLTISLSLKIDYGHSIFPAAAALQKALNEQITSMTAKYIAGIKIQAI
jgi:hypothetical protein